ncbi:MAG: hypothetical protein J5I98_14480 [Phaeodactylibacter sp.]|nr:hypothetical protein [Phaeodactylibacter sp.]
MGLPRKKIIKKSPLSVTFPFGPSYTGEVRTHLILLITIDITNTTMNYNTQLTRKTPSVAFGILLRSVSRGQALRPDVADWAEKGGSIVVMEDIVLGK